jgi:glycosyltransferase involved in cell wall biosynthesis
MIAYHFPPVQGSSGVHRTLKFVRHLPQLGWEPIVLTVRPSAYPSRGEDLSAEVPQGIVVRRAACLDSGRHLAIRGRYSMWTALPDRWISWLPAGVLAGIRLVRRHRPQVIWSTYPIATAHLIGWCVARATGLPWVADFRDPMCQDGYPTDRRQWRAFEWVERRAVLASRAVTFTAPSALRTYAERYPGEPATRMHRLDNGFDEEDFAGLPRTPPSPPRARLTLVHSGTLYPSERDPTQLFAALSRLRRDGRIGPESFRLVLRATGDDAFYTRMLAEAGLTDLVELAPPIDHRAAIAEMLAADGLLLLQASNCDEQIPAKVYEYLRAGRPIVALTTRSGDTGSTLLSHGIEPIARLDDAAGIRDGLAVTLDRIRTGTATIADARRVAGASRQAQAARLAELLARVVA